MRSIDEGHLCFEFDREWMHISKWDDCDEFKNGICGVQSVKALDIIALSKTECVLIEIKDYRDQNDEEARQRKNSKKYRQPEERKNAAGELVEQVAQKVAGTVAGLVGAARTQKETRFASDFATFLASQASAGRKVRVVLWVEGQPTSKGRSARAKVNLLVLTRKLKRKMKWLTEDSVQVLSTASPPELRGITVIDRRP